MCFEKHTYDIKSSRSLAATNAKCQMRMHAMMSVSRKLAIHFAYIYAYIKARMLVAAQCG